MLEFWTTQQDVVIVSNVKAIELFNRRVIVAKNAFAEIVAWKVAQPVLGSRHGYKYRLALVVDGRCILRYDNEAGKGDHKHVGEREQPYIFLTIEQLVADFFQDVMRWRNENGNA